MPDLLGVSPAASQIHLLSTLAHSAMIEDTISGGVDCEETLTNCIARDGIKPPSRGSRHKATRFLQASTVESALAATWLMPWRAIFSSN
jgi:hypothetical protein